MMTIFIFTLNNLKQIPLCLSDPGFGHPLCPEEHPEESGCEGLALVEALHHSTTSSRGSAHRRTDSRKRRESFQSFLFISRPGLLAMQSFCQFTAEL